MTNLLEKALLIAFGVFLLIIFFSIINPFYSKVVDYYRNEEYQLDDYISVIDEVTDAVNFVFEDPESNYISVFDYPANLNISIDRNFIVFDFLLDQKIDPLVKNFENQLVPRHYHDVPPGKYVLNVSYQNSFVDVMINALN